MVSGKTSLAYLIAYELSKKIYILNGTALQKPSDIISPLTSIKEGEIIFIDEVHAVSKEVLEVLYPVLEDNKINLIIGKEYNAKIINVNLPQFTLIVATTEINKLTAPFINRFPINFIFASYSIPEISKILAIQSQKMNLNLDAQLFEFLATHCKNNPRIAVNLLKRVHDFLIIEKPVSLNLEYLKTVLRRLDIYKYGLSSLDLAYLKILKENQSLGLESLKQILNLQYGYILNSIEPNLLVNGLIIKTQKGRQITDRGVLLLEEFNDKSQTY
ncbi:Holliday junction DNA helicase RuvB [Spiroplasma clarkii]|uniref:Holliday junction DNA helicase RuvB C-terminal domain-containing protein n=1 Tax=Spiroplasma clarkii TaxID=2139 RepID=UPI000B577F6C|nr:Holliday junction DNA helicase RuvB C-terminal domain-containing protein [Spiroplasma clarkii]ARU91604.1 Holliday junction DNA helicase RuvB [Spiroplasma clarkii]